jgi:hypothetical protein
MAARTLNEMAQDLKDLIETAAICREVRVAAITSHEQLYKFIPTLSRLPAAVVCLGPGDYDPTVSVRDVSPGILLVAPFEATAEKKAVAIWTLLDSAADLFIPPNGPRSALNINDVIYRPTGFRPVAADSTCSAYLLELDAQHATK